MGIITRRLTADDADTARHLFTLMVDVFGATRTRLSDSYLTRLLISDRFWAIATFAGDEVLGGLAAHILAIKRTESTEAPSTTWLCGKNTAEGVSEVPVAEIRDACSAQFPATRGIQQINFSEKAHYVTDSSSGLAFVAPG